MAHSLSAQKRVRQSAKRRDRNRLRKKALRAESRKIVALVSKGDVAALKEETVKAIALTDKIRAKGAIHRNTAARRKSKLAKQLNKLAAAKA